MARRLRAGLWIAAVAWIVGMPLVAHHFGRLHPYAALTSLLLTPFVATTMTLGLGHWLLAVLWPSAATALTAPLARTSAATLQFVVETCAELPCSALPCWRPGGWVLALFYAMAVILWRASRTNTQRVRRLGTLMLATSAGFWLLSMRGAPCAPRLTAFSIPGGSAALLEWPGWGNLVIDCGSRFEGAARAIGPALEGCAVRKIRSVIITTAARRHDSALEEVTERFGPSGLAAPPNWQAMSPTACRSVRRSRPAVARLSRQSPAAELLPPEVRVLWPPASLPKGAAAEDGAMLLSLDTPAGRVLVAGTLGPYAQRRLLEASPGLEADVLVVPADGGARRLSPAFIRAVNPTLFVGWGCSDLSTEIVCGDLAGGALRLETLGEMAISRAH